MRVVGLTPGRVDGHGDGHGDVLDVVPHLLEGRIRRWEAIAAKKIPVLISVQYAQLGDKGLHRR